MGSGMNVEQAKELASKRTYSWAVSNVRTGRNVMYKKATMIKLRELADIADKLDRLDKADVDCMTCVHRSEPWYSEVCDGCTKANSHYERKEQTE